MRVFRSSSGNASCRALGSAIEHHPALFRSGLRFSRCWGHIGGRCMGQLKLAGVELPR